MSAIIMPTMGLNGLIINQFKCKDINFPPFFCSRDKNNYAGACLFDKQGIFRTPFITLRKTLSPADIPVPPSVCPECEAVLFAL